MDTKLQKDNIQTAFEATLKDTNFHDLGFNLAEMGIDTVLSDGVLKDVPIIGTMVSITKVGVNIKDRLFLKKVLHFLNGLNDITPAKRVEMIDKIDNSKEYRIKVGEKLLYIIDSCEDYEISELVSKVFKYFLDEQITYDEFLKTTSVLKNMNKVDFNWFIKDRENYYFDLSDAGDLINSGLFELYYEQVSVRVDEESDMKTLREGGQKYTTDVDGGVSVHLSRSGEIILEIFSTTYKKKTIKKI